MSRALLAFLVVLLASWPTRLAADTSGAATYAAHGVIEKIAPDHRTVTIHHQAIPGYMMEMTMDFPVHDPVQLDRLAQGDKVDFTLHVTPTDSWVDGFHLVGHGSPNAAPPASDAPATAGELKPGDLLPDVAFLAETGKTVHLADYRGKVVILTFFFTRCPLPNYCPLMNRDFAQTRALLRADPSGPRNWAFLSISFDPDYDKPANLASFGKAYRGEDTQGWLFVAATPEAMKDLAAPLGLMVMRSGNGISHNLRTAVVDPEGRLYVVFNGNQWTSAQLAEAVRQAAGRSR